MSAVFSIYYWSDAALGTNSPPAEVSI